MVNLKKKRFDGLQQVFLLKLKQKTLIKNSFHRLQDISFFNTIFDTLLHIFTGTPIESPSPNPTNIFDSDNSSNRKGKVTWSLLKLVRNRDRKGSRKAQTCSFSFFSVHFKKLVFFG